jgi:hypothetical protein
MPYGHTTKILLGTVHVRVRGSAAAGPAWAQATPTATPWVLNDACETATRIDVLPYGTVPDDGSDDRADGPAPSCRTNSRAHSVWFRFDATSTAPLIVETVGSNYDTAERVRRVVPRLTEVACTMISTQQLDSRRPSRPVPDPRTGSW